MEALIGTRDRSAGSIRMAGREATNDRVSSRLAMGLALVPEDGNATVWSQSLSVRANVLLATLGTLTKRFLLSNGAGT